MHARGAVFFLLAALAAPAADARDCAPIFFGKAYSTADEAAMRAIETLLLDGGQWESGGFVIEKNGVFRASRPVTQRSRENVDYCIALPRGARLAGLYHTHVASSALSARDRANAERAGVPSYIGNLRDGTLVVYDGVAHRTRPLERVLAAAPDRSNDPTDRVERFTQAAAALFAQAAELARAAGERLDAAASALFGRGD